MGIVGAFQATLAAAGLVDPPLPPPWLAAAGQKRLGGSMAKIKENEEKTATLGVPRGASHPLLTCGYICYCIWGNWVVWPLLKCKMIPLPPMLNFTCN